MEEGIGAAKAHVKYLQRAGVTQEGEPGRLYDAIDDDAVGKAFVERSEGARHQFRFIISPEDGSELEDLKPFVRGLMIEMQRDLDFRAMPLCHLRRRRKPAARPVTGW